MGCVSVIVRAVSLEWNSAKCQNVYLMCSKSVIIAFFLTAAASYPQQRLSPVAAAAPRVGFVWGAEAWRRDWGTECPELRSPSPARTASHRQQTARRGSENTVECKYAAWSYLVGGKEIQHFTCKEELLRRLENEKTQVPQVKGFTLNKSIFAEGEYFVDWLVQIWALPWSWCCPAYLPAPYFSSFDLQDV